MGATADRKQAMHIETERLELRDVVAGDAVAMHVFFGDCDLTKYTNFYAATFDDTRHRIEDWIFHNHQSPRFAHNCAIVEKASHDVVGWIGFGHARDKTIGDRDFGYALRRDRWNRGYMTEALTGVLTFCFAELRVASVFGVHRPQHPVSGRVMEKAGMRYAGMFPSRSEEGVIERRLIALRDDWLAGRDLAAVRILTEPSS